MGTHWCPQCGSDLVAPSALNSAWRCSQHGQVLPLSVYHRVDTAALEHIRSHAEVPLWLPDPRPNGWEMSGLATVGDARSRVRGTVASFSGPAPLGGHGEWLIVAEEPGIGLGATYAASAIEATDELTTSAPAAKVMTHGRPTPLWAVPDSASDRSAYVGEADGVWLWLVGFPSDAGYAVLEDLSLSDLRVRQPQVLAHGTTSTRLRPGDHSRE